MSKWRPRFRSGMVSIRREGNFFAIVCRSVKEANSMEKAVIKSLCKSRRRKKAELPEIYKGDLANAISAVTRGADAFKVYRRIAGQYPGKSAELKRILLYTPSSQRLDVLRQALGLGNE